MSDLAKVGFSLPANRSARHPDTPNSPICPTPNARVEASPAELVAAGYVGVAE